MFVIVLNSVVVRKWDIVLAGMQDEEREREREGLGGMRSGLRKVGQ